jgi:AcrR family transcriptional regulator
MGHRDQLLAAARKLLQDKGYAHITARDLVAESGTNLASIGYHFGSKAGLLNAALGSVFEEWTTELVKVAMSAEHETPVERCLRAWSVMLEQLPGQRAMLLSFVEALAQADRDPDLRTQLAEIQRGTRDRVSAVVAESLGTTPDDPACRALASFIMAVCDGLATQWLVNPEQSPTGEELRAGLNSMWGPS